MNLVRIEKHDKKQANYRVKGSKFGKKKERNNYRAGVCTIYELDEEYLNTKQLKQLEES